MILQDDKNQLNTLLLIYLYKLTDILFPVKLHSGGDLMGYNGGGGGYGSGFALIVVLFILLIIVGVAFVGGGY